jgi:hypothetical protein
MWKHVSFRIQLKDIVVIWDFCHIAQTKYIYLQVFALLHNWYATLLTYITEFVSVEQFKNLWSQGLCNRVTHYVTMVDNNRGRFFLAVEPAYADVEYLFFISLRWYYMLLLSCRLHNCRPHRLDCGVCARACATLSSCGHAPYYNCSQNANLLRPHLDIGMSERSWLNYETDLR